MRVFECVALDDYAGEQVGCAGELVDSLYGFSSSNMAGNSAANLTADPELRFSPTGRAVATVRFAVNTRKRTVGGDWVDQPASYFTGTSWGAMAEHAAQSVQKGDRVLVQGTLVTRTYRPSEGARAGENLSASRSRSTRSARRCGGAPPSSQAQPADRARVARIMVLAGTGSAVTPARYPVDHRGTVAAPTVGQDRR
jgi:single-strand DNA-binding protein